MYPISLNELIGSSMGCHRWLLLAFGSPFGALGACVWLCRLWVLSSAGSARRCGRLHPRGEGGSAVLLELAPVFGGLQSSERALGRVHRAVAGTSFGMVRVRYRSANRDRTRVPLVVPCVALPASVGIRTPWGLRCSPLMGYRGSLSGAAVACWAGGSSDPVVLQTVERFSLRGGPSSSRRTGRVGVGSHVRLQSSGASFGLAGAYPSGWVPRLVEGGAFCA